MNQIPSKISNQISEKCCNKNHFDKAAPDCNIALKNSGFNNNVTYIPSMKVPTAKLERDKLFGSIRHIVLMRKLTLVKFSWDLLINIFPVTINILSYSTEITSNQVAVACLAWIMSSKNIILKLWRIQHHLPSKMKKTVCTMDGNCLSECIIYKASVNTTTSKYCYVTCENTFKERFNNHKCSFRNRSR